MKVRNRMEQKLNANLTIKKEKKATQQSVGAIQKCVGRRRIKCTTKRKTNQKQSVHGK
jgi:hypothetical protein